MHANFYPSVMLVGEVLSSTLVSGCLAIFYPAHFSEIIHSNCIILSDHIKLTFMEPVHCGLILAFSPSTLKWWPLPWNPCPSLTVQNMNYTWELHQLLWVHHLNMEPVHCGYICNGDLLTINLEMMTFNMKFISGSLLKNNTRQLLYILSNANLACNLYVKTFWPLDIQPWKYDLYLPNLVHKLLAGPAELFSVQLRYSVYLPKYHQGLKPFLSHTLSLELNHDRQSC